MSIFIFEKINKLNFFLKSNKAAIIWRIERPDRSKTPNFYSISSVNAAYMEQ